MRNPEQGKDLKSVSKGGLGCPALCVLVWSSQEGRAGLLGYTVKPYLICLKRKVRKRGWKIQQIRRKFDSNLSIGMTEIF